MGAVALILGIWGFITASNYRKMHNISLAESLKASLMVAIVSVILLLAFNMYQGGADWLGHLSYLGIFLLLLAAVTVAIALAFVLIGFFYKRDKSNRISRVDAGASAASINIISISLFLLGGYAIYFGITELSGLQSGQIKALVFEPTAGQYGSLNALFIFTLAPVFAALWVKLGKLNLDPSTPVKFSLGLIQVGLGFGALLIGALTPDEAGKVAWVWLMLAYLLHTTGELSLSPVGLSAVTKLSIKSVVSLVMGVWFLATSLSEVVAVLLAKIAALDADELVTLSVSEQLDKYNELWSTLLYLGVGFGIVMLLVSPLLKKGMKGIH
ncbi:POT-type proton-dependent oligopeptide transporter [Marinicella sediminis]